MTSYSEHGRMYVSGKNNKCLSCVSWLLSLIEHGVRSQSKRYRISVSNLLLF